MKCFALLSPSLVGKYLIELITGRDPQILRGVERGLAAADRNYGKRHPPFRSKGWKRLVADLLQFFSVSQSRAKHSRFGLRGVLLKQRGKRSRIINSRVNHKPNLTSSQSSYTHCLSLGGVQLRGKCSWFGSNLLLSDRDISWPSSGHKLGFQPNFIQLERITLSMWEQVPLKFDHAAFELPCTFKTLLHFQNKTIQGNCCFQSTLRWKSMFTVHPGFNWRTGSCPCDNEHPTVIVGPLYWEKASTSLLLFSS